MIKKVFIYGHKNNHTHSYIHSSYYKAFKSLGYESYWIDHNEISNYDFSNSLFLTEGQVDINIPLRSDCYYVLHHCNLEKYIQNNCKYIQLGNYLKFCDEGKNHYYPNDSLTKIKDQTFFDYKNILLYQMWATDLLPKEIDENDIKLYDSSLSDVNYIGSIWYENQHLINPFVNSCRANNKNFVSRVNVSDDKHKTLIRNSYICPDIRGDWHVECGYIPCRNFKNVSYGKMTGTNSENVYNVFEGMIPYEKDINNLFSVCEEFYKKTTKKDMKNLIKFVKDNHTYLNRIGTILNMFKEIYE